MAPPGGGTPPTNLEDQLFAALQRHAKTQNTGNFNNTGPDPVSSGGYGSGGIGDAGRTSQQNFANFSKYILKSGKTTKKVFDNYLQGSNDLMLGFAKNYEKINRAIGGYTDHADMVNSGQKTMVEAVGRFDDLVDMYGETSDSFIAMQREKGKALSAEEEARLQTVGVDFVTKYFESGEEAAAAQAEVLNKLVTQNSTAINEMDRVSRAQIGLINKNTGIGAARIAQIMENELIRTGEATNTAMFKIAGYSEALAEDTGLSLKLIQDSTSKVIANMQQFGHVTVEEAQRISVQIQQLGMKYETFESLASKFQNFSTSVSAAGDISQLTGGAVQLDAQELSYLASEDQDAFLRELRSSFLDQGFDKEQFLALTNAEQRTIAESMGMQRNEFAMMIDRERDISSQAELDAVMKGAEDANMTTEAGGMAAIKKQRKNLENAIKSTDDIAESARRKAMKNYKEVSSETMENILSFQTNAVQTLQSPKFVKKFNNATAGVFKNFSSGLNNYVKSIKKGGGIIESLDALSGDFLKAGKVNGESYKSGLEAAGIGNPAKLISQIGSIEKVTTNASKLQANITKVSKLLADLKKEDVDKYQILIDKMADNINDLNEKSAQQITSQKDLITALMKGTNVSVQIDGKEVTKAVINNATTTQNVAGNSLQTNSQ